MNAVRERSIERLRQMVLDALGDHDAEVWLFGSCATGDARHASDIDVGILAREELPGSFMADLSDLIEESTIPYDVDLVDLRTVGPEFRERIVRTGIKWRD